MNEFVLQFARKHKALFSGKIIDVGAFNVNGALSSELPITLRVDMRKGKGVDQICKGEDLIKTFGENSFDCVVSGDMLEHAFDWRGCVNNMWGVLKDDGYLLLTMAHHQKGRHAYPDDYWRFKPDKFRSLFDGNPIIDHFANQPSIGVIVQKKTKTLDLSLEPIKVP